MPWRGASVEGELPSLGWELLDWWSDYLPSPRDHDEPLVFTDEQARILIRWFTIDPRTGKFVYQRGCSRRSKGWGKSPVEAAKCIAELAGPVLFDGWDAHGEPVGRPWGTRGDAKAWVQLAAVSEDQTENTNSVVFELLTANDGAAADDLKIDAGRGRCYLADGKRTGKLETVTAAAGSREGQPVTYGEMDETHLWLVRNGGVKLARTLRRNVAKMGGRTYETTNSFEPGESSVAEATHKAAEKGAAGVFYDAVEADQVDIDTATDAELEAALAKPYGDSWWVDRARLVVAIRDPDTPREDVERFFFNWNRKGGGKAVDPKLWAARRTMPADWRPDAGTRVGLGFDGSISQDATALVGCTPQRQVFVIGSWERPAGVDTWKVPRLAVHAAVAEAFATWTVGRMLCDPPKWESEIEGWAAEHGDEVVLAFDTNKAARMAPACERFATALDEEPFLAHGGDEDERDVLTRHVLALTKKKVRVADDDDDGRTRYVFTKGPDGRKIDAGIAAILAVEAAATMPAASTGGWMVAL